MMFDMNKCKTGDKLISCHGAIFTYLHKQDSDYPHLVRYPEGSLGSRTDEGFVAHNNRLPTDHNIIGFAKMPWKLKADNRVVGTYPTADRCKAVACQMKDTISKFKIYAPDGKLWAKTSDSNSWRLTWIYS